MKLKKISAVLILFFMIAAFIPKLGLAANYNYDYTLLGLGVDQSGPSEVNIVDEQSSFKSSDTIHVLTGLSNIVDANSFRVKHEVLANGTSVYATNYTPVFSPYNQTWERTSTWTEFFGLPEGNHQIRVSISLNGGAYEEVDLLNISVAGVAGTYEYASTRTGLGVDQISDTEVLIIDEKVEFSNNESIFVLSKLSNIANITNFRVRHEVLANGTSILRTLYSPTFYPNNSIWALTNTWTEIGTLPAGEHRINVAVSVNGGTYQEVDRVDISVTGVAGNYLYEGTDLGLGVRDTGNWDYGIVDSGSEFSSSEEVYVLSHLSNIQNIGSFRFKHEIIDSNNAVYRVSYTPLFTPDYGFWANNDTWTVAGRLPAGSHTVRVSISIDGGEYVEIDSLPINITGSLNNYNYQDTVLGQGVLTLENGQVQITDQASSFSDTDQIFALTTIADIENISTFRFKHEVLAGGTSLFRMLESPLFQPNGQYWSETTTWNQIGALPAGDHKIRVSVSLDGGEYQELELLNVIVY